jgi:hypothetical protein
MAKYALYDKDGKFFMATDNGQEADKVLMEVLKTGTLLQAKHLTQIQLLTLTADQAYALQPNRIREN